jgi:hypothetical protein
MINTIFIGVCTAINCALAFYWIRQLDKQYKNSKRKRHRDLCKRCIEVGSCPHNCELCAWGDYMTERQLNQNKKVKKFWKKILE